MSPWLLDAPVLFGPSSETLLLLVAVPLLFWLGVRCAIAWVGWHAERQEGTVETSEQAGINLIGCLVWFGLALALTWWIWWEEWGRWR